MKPKNLKLCLEPKSTLFREEANVIIAVLLEMLKHDDRMPRAGTFMLYGMKDDTSEIQRIISFNFKGGCFGIFLGCSHDSDELGKIFLERAAKEMSKKTAIRNYKQSAEFMELKTTCGKFMCFFFGDVSYSDAYVYCTVAKTIALMSKEDTVLQKSCDYLFSTYLNDRVAVELAQYIEELFDKRELLALRKWKKWHNLASKNNMSLFFQ